MKLKHLILTIALTLLVSKGFAFETIGNISQDLFTNIQGSIEDQVNLVAKYLSKYVASLLGTLYSIWLMWRVFKAIIDNNAKEVVQLLFKQTALLIVVLFLILNLNVIDNFLQKPIVETYNMFGNTILKSSLGIDGNEGLIKSLALQMQDVSLALIGEKFSLLNFTLLPILLKFAVLVMLFMIFIQIFLILITNYFKIMLPFAISPILLMFFFFPSLRQISIKALNIALDGIIKQGFIIMVVIIMSKALETALTNGGYGLNLFDLDQLLIIIIVSFIYKQLLTTADSLSSELIGTQQLGVNPTQGGGLIGAMAGAAAMGMKYLNAGGDTALGGLVKGAVGGLTGKGVSTGGASTIQGKAANVIGSTAGAMPAHLAKLGWKFTKDNY